MDTSSPLVYVGFWARLWATCIDTALLSALMSPALILVYGAAPVPPIPHDGSATLAELVGLLVRGPVDFAILWVFPALAVVAFWRCKGATPGKMAIRAHIVDARTGGRPSVRRLALRYLGYFVSTLPLFLGYVWVAFDPRKQGWHDKMAGTIVVRRPLTSSA